MAWPAELDLSDAPAFVQELGQRGVWLEDLFVRPTHRGAGVGRALLVKVAELAVARGCARFEWTVLDWNALAIGFYRSLGAVPMDEWTRFRLDGEALAALARSSPQEDLTP